MAKIIFGKTIIWSEIYFCQGVYSTIKRTYFLGVLQNNISGKKLTSLSADKTSVYLTEHRRKKCSLNKYFQSAKFSPILLVEYKNQDSKSNW